MVAGKMGNSGPQDLPSLTPGGPQLQGDLVIPHKRALPREILFVEKGRKDHIWDVHVWHCVVLGS